MSSAGKKRRVKKQAGTSTSGQREPIDSGVDESTAAGESGRRLGGDRVASESGEAKTLVWRAVLFGAAVALVLVMIPSYLAVPRLGRMELTAFQTSVDGGLRMIAETELPPYSAGIAPGRPAGRSLVAVPGQKRIDVLELVYSSGPVADTADAPTPAPSVGTFTQPGSISVGGGPVVMATSIERGLVLVIENDSSELRLVDLQSDEVTRTIAAGRRPVAAAVSDAAAVAAVANLESSSITLVDLPSLATKDIGVSERPRYMALTDDSVYVAGENQKQIDVVDLATATRKDPISLEFNSSSLAACGGWLLAGESQGNHIAIVDPENHARTRIIDAGTRPRVLLCLSTGLLAVGGGPPADVSLYRVSSRAGGEEPDAISVGSTRTSAQPAFLAEISPGIVAVAGSRSLSTLFSIGLMVANLFGVLIGGVVTGILARKNYGAHALAVTGVLLGAYWIVFQGAQPAALPTVLIFVGIPVLATAASGTLLARLAVERITFFSRTPRAKPDEE